MSKFLVRASYTSEGVQGLLKEGGSSRVEAVTQLTNGMGGSVECFYYAFGDDDVVGIIDMPDHASAAALSLAVNASGAVSVKATVLLTAEEMDEATKKTVNYRPPANNVISVGLDGSFSGPKFIPELGITDSRRWENSTSPGLAASCNLPPLHL